MRFSRSTTSLVTLLVTMIFTSLTLACPSSEPRAEPVAPIATAPTDNCAECRQLVKDVCAACHGETGVSADDAYPNLAGQRKTYILKQLRNFRAKSRADEIMNAMAEPLSDEMIEGLATYFSTLPLNR